MAAGVGGGRKKTGEATHRPARRRGRIYSWKAIADFCCKRYGWTLEEFAQHDEEQIALLLEGMHEWQGSKQTITEDELEELGLVMK